MAIVFAQVALLIAFKYFFFDMNVLGVLDTWVDGGIRDTKSGAG
jgi:hypothetical protein